MKKLSKKSALVFSGLLAVCAIAAPMASAASWSVIGTTHVLSSNNLAFTAVTPLGTVGSSCLDSEFHVDVRSAAVLTITAAAFRGCSGNAGIALGCSVSATATNLDWTATAVTTTNVQIHGVDVDVRFSGPCLANNVQTRLTGTLTGGTVTPSSDPAARRVHFNHAHGLTSHSALGNSAAFVTGTFRDTTQTLNVLD